MTEHQAHEPPASYTYAVGAGLGLVLGGGLGIVIDTVNFIPAAVLGVVVGIVGAFLVKTLLP